MCIRDRNKSACRRRYNDKKSYTAKELKSKEDWNEWQANVLGAAILMPRRDVSILAESMLGDRKIIVAFDRCSEYDASIIRNLSEFFHASPVAVKIRLQRLGYLEDHTLDILAESMCQREAIAI